MIAKFIQIIVGLTCGVVLADMAYDKWRRRGERHE